MMNKREFLLAAGAACAVALPALPVAAAQWSRPRPNLAHGGDGGVWQTWIGQRFELRGGDVVHAVVLSEVRRSPSSPHHAQFTVVFDGATKVLADGIHVLRHASGQELDLFVESITGTPGRSIAQFSLLT
jgi:hypothetical protein